MRRVALVSTMALACLAATTAAGGVGTRGAARGPRPATTPAVRSDFDGDGITDLAIGERFALVNGDVQAGAVHVLLGSSNGPVVPGNVVITEKDLVGGLDAPNSQWFGGRLASGDFNRDGFADLAVQGQDDTIGNVPDTGRVFVLYGSASGLKTTGFLEFDKSTPGMEGDLEGGDDFGTALLAADLDGDGFADLAVGDQFGTVNAANDAGDVYVLFGSGSGLSTTGHLYLTKGPTGVGGQPTAGDDFGSSLAAGNYTGDPHPELVIGARGEKVGAAAGAGAVYLVRGTGAGPDPSAGVLRITQNSPGVGDQAEPDDAFGAQVLAANLGRGARIDLVVGSFDEVVNGFQEAGAIDILYGKVGGLTGQGSQFLTQATPGVPGTPSAFGDFGAALAAGNVGGPRIADLILGAPGQRVNGVRGGAVVVLFGSLKGVTTAGALLISQATPGVPGHAEDGGGFGNSVAVRAFGNGAPADLAIGAQGMTAGGHGQAGGAYVLFGAPHGPTGSGSLLYTEATPGMLDSPQDFELFGATLA